MTFDPSKVVYFSKMATLHNVGTKATRTVIPSHNIGVGNSEQHDISVPYPINSNELITTTRIKFAGLTDSYIDDKWIFIYGIGLFTKIFNGTKLYVVIDRSLANGMTVKVEIKTSTGFSDPLPTLTIDTYSSFFIFPFT